VGKVFKAPEKWTKDKGQKTLFLAGSIEQGKAVDWQTKLTKEFEDDDSIVILNPRRDDWDSSWKESIKNKQFKEQVTWELDAQEQADLICMYFDKETKSPITLMELGLFCKKPMVVCCPDGFWKKGNVEVVCERNSIPLVTDFDEFVTEIKKKLKMNKEAIKKTAVEPVNPLEGGDALSGIDDAGDEGLGGGDLGGDLGGGLGGGLDGGLGGGLDEVAEGMGNDYYDALKVTRTPDLENQIQHDDMDDLDYTKLT